jgi:hypothetical protein
LKDFQGGNFSLNANGEDTDIYAANGAGKTRLASAWSWLLFGKDSLGRSDFELKNLDATGETEHGLDHIVEGAIEVDGTPLTLKKVYHEVWSKKRGSPQAVLTGNTVDHFVDGVPTKEIEYKGRISEIFGDESIVRLLTSPTAFPALPWQKQRTLLLDVCGDITDVYVISTDDALAPLTDLLKKYTVSKTPLDDLRKVTMAGRLEINKALDQLPVRIDECRRGLPDISGLDRAVIENEVQAYEHYLSDAKLRLSGIDNGSSIAELSKKLAGIEADISKIERAHYTQVMTEVDRLNREIENIADAARNAERKAKSLSDNIGFKKQTLESMDGQLARLRDKWTAIDAETFEDTTESVCPACGQSLPAERVHEAQDKALAAFNMKRAERLAEVEREGKIVRGAYDLIKTEIADLHQDLLNLPKYEPANVEELTAKRDAVKQFADNYTGLTERTKLVFEKERIEREIGEARGSVKVDRDKIDGEVADLTVKLAEAKADADKFTRREQGEKRIEDLKADEKRLAREFEDLERIIFLVESFIKRKVSLLTDKINARFEIVKWKLYDVQVNGGVSECCVATVGGIPYDAGLNSAARTQAGLDIIRTLQGHYGMRGPVIIDNRESCTKIPRMDCQVLSLYVSPADKALRVEKSREDRRVAA